MVHVARGTSSKGIRPIGFRHLVRNITSSKLFFSLVSSRPSPTSDDVNKIRLPSLVLTLCSIRTVTVDCGRSFYTVAIMIADREYNERDQRDVGRGYVSLFTSCERDGASLEGSFRPLRRHVDRLLRSRSCDLQNVGVTASQDTTIRFQVSFMQYRLKIFCITFINEKLLL